MITDRPSFRDHHPAFDGLRALAVTLVVLYHFMPDLLPYRLMEIGLLGVDLFFVLSGFLITGILLDTRGHQGYYRTFIVRRALRILPLSYGVLAIVFVTAAITDHPGLRDTAADQLWFWTYTQNLLFAFHGWPGDMNILAHFWSLAVEEQFYLLWPFVVLWVPKQRLHWVLLPALVLGPVLRYLNYTEIPFALGFTLARLDGLLIGSLLAHAIRFQRDKLLKWWRTFGLMALLGVTALITARVRAGGHPHPDVIQYTITAGPFVFSLLWGCFLVRCLDPHGPTWRPFHTAFTWGLVRAVGRISYGIYVLHVFLIPLRPIVVGYVMLKGGSEETSRLIASLLYFPAVIALSMASYRFLEKPFLRLKDRWAPYR